MNPYFTDYAEYIDRFYPGEKIQKISINTGAGCPNRDGTIARGGCIYCNNRSFTPSYCFGTTSVRDQIEAGKKFFGRKYKDMKFIAYFQSYTNTHKADAGELKTLYEKALGIDRVVGLAVGTRPDCLPDEVTDILADINRRHPVFIELGVETLSDDTLRIINRGHRADASRESIRRLSAAGLHVGVHLIAGLPGEDTDRILKTIDEICNLPVESIKLHHLQVLKETPLQRMIESGELKIPMFSIDDYIDLSVKIIRRVPRGIAIERFLASSPPDMVVYPKWGLKNYEFTNKLLGVLAKA